MFKNYKARKQTGGAESDPLFKQQELQRRFSFLELCGIVLVPWLVCVMISYMFATQYHRTPLLVWLIVFAAAVTSCSQIRIEMPEDSWRSSVALGCLAAVLVSSFFGCIAYQEFYADYWSCHDSHTYANVMPSEAASAYLDAGKVIFAEEARIDVSRAVGYKDSTVYCVAPVLDSAGGKTIQFWAAGKDCCGSRGSFSCDDAWDNKARGGIVISEAAVQPEYALAVRQAEAAYGVKSVAEPVFVRWVVDPEKVELNYWRLGNGVLVGVCIIFLALAATTAMAFNLNVKQYAERVGFV